MCCSLPIPKGTAIAPHDHDTASDADHSPYGAADHAAHDPDDGQAAADHADHVGDDDHLIFSLALSI